MMEFRKYAKRVSRLALLAHNPKACLTDGQGFRARISVVILLFAINIQAQEEPKKWEISGYAKSLQGIFNTEIPPLGKTVLNDNFLHNRLNFKWYPNDNLTIKADLRNRLFFGEFNRKESTGASILFGIHMTSSMHSPLQILTMKNDLVQMPFESSTILDSLAVSK